MSRDQNIVSTFVSDSLFLQAIEKGEVIPFYQRIVDSAGETKGFELLCRWKTPHGVRSPGEFLPNLQSVLSFEKLTGLLLDAAVSCINLYEGKYYFSVNIPECLMRNGVLPALLEKASRGLRKSFWVNRIALEFSERIDFRSNGGSADVVMQLKSQGYKVLLDDCYSSGSGIFPVRMCQFDAYKIDMSLVRDILNDGHALILVKTLAYYCELTHTQCIAEGIEDYETYMVLASLGVTAFQGYRISEPVEFADIEKILPEVC